MSKTLKNFRVVVASPSDVQAERDLLLDVVNELNKSIGAEVGLRLELVRWETDSIPEFGQDPQALLNQQVFSDFDIFIGILWQRFGTPTPRAESGTVEEFENAYKRHQEDESVHVAFYFKTQEVSPQKVDLEQLGKVRKFKESIGARGLYGLFGDSEEFERMIRIHLTRILMKQVTGQKLSDQKDKRKATADEPAILGDDDSEESDEELGFLDLMERVESNMAISTSMSDEISGHLRQLGNDADEITARIVESNQSQGDRKFKLMRSAFNDLAKRMSQFSEAVDKKRAIMSDAFERGIDAIQEAAILIVDIDENPRDGLESVFETCKELRLTLQGTREKLGSLQNTVLEMPRFTTTLNRSKRRTSETLELLNDELDRECQLLEEAQLLVGELLENLRPEARTE